MRRLLASLLLACALPASGDLWVTVNGAGSQNGTSLANACAGGTAGTSDTDCTTFTDGETVRYCDAFTAAHTVPNAGTDAASVNTYTCECPGGTPATFNGARIFATGRNYWGINGATFRGSPAGQSAIACFICETSKGGSCSSREGACEGFQATNNTVLDSAKSGIEIGTVGGQNSYGTTTGVVIAGNRVERSAAHGIIMAGNIVSPTERDNTVTESNYTGAFNAWGVYTAPRAGNCSVSSGCAANWVTAGFTCAAGTLTQYRITLPQTTAGGTVLAANEVVTQVIVQGFATGHYAVQSAASCNPGSGLGSRRWCQDGANIHVCGTELNPPTDNDVTIVTSAHGPVTMGEGDDISGTKNSNGTQDGVGIGSDIGASNVTIRGAFTHDNEGRGAEFNMCPVGCVFESTISAHNGTWGFLANNMANATDVVSGYNLVSLGNRSEPFRISNAGATAVQLYNSTLIGTGSQNCVNVALGGGEGGNHSRNCTATHLTTGITGDPKLVGGATPSTIDGFRPREDSPLCRAGLSLLGVSTFDGLQFESTPTIGAFRCGAPRAAGLTRRMQ